jgi:hypothetical protein
MTLNLGSFLVRQGQGVQRVIDTRSIQSSALLAGD